MMGDSIMARRTGRPSFLLSFSELPDSHYNRVEEKLRLDAFAWIVYLKMFRRMAVSTLCKQPGNIETGEELCGVANTWLLIVVSGKSWTSHPKLCFVCFNRQGDHIWCWEFLFYAQDISSPKPKIK